MLSQASKGISLGALGLVEFFGYPLDGINLYQQLLRAMREHRKITIIVCSSLFMTLLGGLIYVLAPKYFVAQQVERDNSTKCKSYRALESIAVAMYREDPNGVEWLSKEREAETRREQHKCSQLVLDK